METNSILEYLLDNIIAIIALLISLLAFWIKFKTYRLASTVFLKLTAEIKPPFKTLDIDLENIGTFNFTLRSIKVVYGYNPKRAQMLYEEDLNKGEFLSQGKKFERKVPVEELKETAKKPDFKSAKRSFIWVMVEHRKNKYLSRVVSIDPELEPEDIPVAIREYYLSNKILGFNYPLTIALRR